MKFLEGKSKEEKTKIIAAIVLGTLAVLALGNLIFSPFSGRKSGSSASTSPTKTATPAAAARRNDGDTVVEALPKAEEMDAIYCCVPLNVQMPPAANDAGRNIFAFFEPPKPTPWIPPPTPQIKIPTPPPPTPAPTPNVIISGINKQSVYAGENGFRLEVTGNGFTPDTPIWFGGTPLPTKFVSPQQLAADVPTNYLAVGRQAGVEVRSADGRLFSNSVLFNIQQAPLPQFQYLGAIQRRRGNNDSGYIMESGKTLPTSVRLNDIIAGRFRVVGITQTRLTVQDINLTFLKPYPIELVKAPGTGGGGNPNNPDPNRGFDDPRMVGPGRSFPGQPNPNFPNQPMQINPQDCPPGIPCDKLKPYVTATPSKQDVDDNDIDNRR